MYSRLTLFFCDSFGEEAASSGLGKVGDILTSARDIYAMLWYVTAGLMIDCLPVKSREGGRQAVMNCLIGYPSILPNPSQPCTAYIHACVLESAALVDYNPCLNDVPRGGGGRGDMEYSCCRCRDEWLYCMYSILRSIPWPSWPEQRRRIGIAGTNVATGRQTHWYENPGDLLGLCPDRYLCMHVPLQVVCKSRGRDDALLGVNDKHRATFGRKLAR